MIKTEKKYWVNGYQIRGGWFKTLNLSILSYGVMFSWGKKGITNRIKLFKFI